MSRAVVQKALQHLKLSKLIFLYFVTAHND